MNKINFIIVAFLLIFSLPFDVFSQQCPRKKSLRFADGGHFVCNNNSAVYSNIAVVRMLKNQDVCKKLGLSEEKTKLLSETLSVSEEKEKELRKKARDISERQSKLLISTLSERQTQPDELKKLFREFADTHVEIASLIVDRMIFVRDNITEKQINEAINIHKSRRRNKMIERQKNMNPQDCVDSVSPDDSISQNGDNELVDE